MLESRIDLPDKSNWTKIVNTALDEISAGHLQKVVLARKTTLTFSNPLDPRLLLLRLRKRAAPTTTKFCLQLNKHQIFLGATPEVLFSREGRILKTMALAGTSTNDHFTDKEKSEVDWAMHGIKEALLPLSESIEIRPLRVLKSTKVSHLHYPIEATLKETTTDAQLIEALHPTPAIGGWPRKEALAFISRYEPFERGPYAAPLGFSSKERSFFAVGIRSAIIEDKRLHLFAGAGIVSGSDPHKEWMELEAKISPFLDIL
jgi:menaquinone-specific isochorismate synthase